MIVHIAVIHFSLRIMYLSRSKLGGLRRPVEAPAKFLRGAIVSMMANARFTPDAEAPHSDVLRHQKLSASFPSPG